MFKLIWSDAKQVGEEGCICHRKDFTGFSPFVNLFCEPGEPVLRVRTLSLVSFPAACYL